MPLDSIRRCKDCRRIVHGEAGNACPYCGGAQLIRLVEHGAPHVRLHAPVLKLALAFCLGLGAMQLMLIYSDAGASSAGRAAPFWQLNLLIGTCTLVYLLLRRLEGDFRALFLIAFCLFAAGEGVALFARAYGINALHLIGALFRHGLLVFSSLSLTAGAADSPAQTRHERVMFAATCGFLFLSILNLLLEYTHRESALVQDAATALVALALALFAAAELWREGKGDKVVL